MSDPGFVPQPRHTRPSGSDLRTSAVENALSEEIEGTLASEGYRLSVSAEGARLTAGSEAGLRNGRSTWRQLLDVATTDAGGTTTVPGIQVDDEPTYSWRGLMVDCSRHFTPIPELQKLIDALALHRMNRLHLHLSEGSGTGRWTERRGGAARMTA